MYLGRVATRHGYLGKPTVVLSNTTKFVRIKEPLHRIFIKVEKNVSKLLAKLKDTAVSSEASVEFSK